MNKNPQNIEQSTNKGTLFGVGCGPGDPELITVKSSRIISNADVIAYPCHPDGKSRAIDIAKPYITNKNQFLPLPWPMTGRNKTCQLEYEQKLDQHYAASSIKLSHHLDEGKNVALLCVGDPILYGSFVHFCKGLSGYNVEIVPGITSPQAASAVSQTALCHYNDTYTVLPATAGKDSIRQSIFNDGAIAIIKLGKKLQFIKETLQECDRLNDAIYVEQATCSAQVIKPLSEIEIDKIPYFSLIIVPSIQVIKSKINL